MDGSLQIMYVRFGQGGRPAVRYDQAIPRRHPAATPAEVSVQAPAAVPALSSSPSPVPPSSPALAESPAEVERGLLVMYSGPIRLGRGTTATVSSAGHQDPPRLISLGPVTAESPTLSGGQTGAGSLIQLQEKTLAAETRPRAAQAVRAESAAPAPAPGVPNPSAPPVQSGSAAAPWLDLQSAMNRQQAELAQQWQQQWEQQQQQMAGMQRQLQAQLKGLLRRLQDVSGD